MSARLPINTPLAVSVASIAIAAVTVLWQLPGVIAAVAAPSPPATPEEMTSPAIRTKLELHDAAAKRYADRFVGRSLFYPPKPPPPPPPPPREDGPKAPPTPVAALPPPEYAGPLTPKAIVGDEVLFSGSGDKSVRLRIGEEASGVKLTSISSPWSIGVRWSEQDYNVRLFQQFKNIDRDVMQSQTPRAAGPMTGLVEEPSSAPVPVGEPVPVTEPSPAPEAAPPEAAPNVPSNSGSPAPQPDHAPQPPAPAPEPVPQSPANQPAGPNQ